MNYQIRDNRIYWKGNDGKGESCDMGSPEGFHILSDLWLRSGWDTKYVYSFTWMGRPIIQLPEDIVRIQEIIYTVQPDLVIETGVAHGGSLVFYASLFKAMGRGRVIGIDIEIRPHNRKMIETHEMSGFIDLVEGSSTAPDVIAQVKLLAQSTQCPLVILDSNHSKTHVLNELRAYAPFVAVGSYIVACDGIMKDLVGAPRSSPEWSTDNPEAAVREFLRERDDFILEEPQFRFNEGQITKRITYWPNAYLRRIK